MKFPKIETLVIFVFFACVAVWAVSKCSSKRAEFVRKTSDSEPERRDTAVAKQTAPPPVNTQNPSAMPAPATTPPAPSEPSPTPGAKPSRPTLSNTPAQSAPPSSDNYSTLYATIDGLKVRKEPGLKGEAIAKLALYEPVVFLNEKTNWTQEISLGHEKVTDHWVKIRTQSGKEGWVFGAGVHYYKMKRQGTGD
jgi:hypothetical protein